MPKSLIKFLKFLISIGLAAVLLYLVFKNVEWNEFWERAKSVDYTWVIVSILLSIVAYVARAYRWNILLEPLGYELKTSRTTLAVIIGYLANLALPRLGEITRCGVLNRNDKVAVPAALGSVVTERLIDVISLFVLILISLFIESERLIVFLITAYKDLSIPSYVLIITAVVGILGVALLIFFIRKQDRLKGKFAKLFKEFISGFLSLRQIKKPLGFIVSTVILWVVYFLMSYIIVFSLPETAHLGIGAGLMLLITGGIALSIPVQSGFGTYHGMIASMLVLYSIDETTGIFLATLLHTSQIVAVAIFGAVAVIISFLIRMESARETTK
ncbi:lysylphosphatidylglycerol synthase transmembrane domain-containing protein [Ekhidna sp. To15]|uniref:lysylphosphatidylglycerol synthase transmembrane domain-containing protein n=1 Tax=Ekhidna sp. To15 TaxID=3395267 RepID=UPI003F51D1C5